MQTEPAQVSTDESGVRSTSGRSVSRRLLSLSVALLLAGCAGVNSDSSPAQTFEVDVPVKTAYERALAQTKMCLVTKDDFPLTSQIDADEAFAFVRVNMTLTDKLLSNVRIVAQSPSRSRVSVQMWGVDVWDMSAVDAMQAAIEFGVPSCVNYFPSTPKQ
ncbi:MAG TPA: hypothetical protein VIC30_07395 [Orrella sp.]